MQKLALLLIIVIADPASAHCYRVWNYPTPQHCGGVYARVAPRPIPHAAHPNNDLLLPDLSAAWNVDDLSEGMQRLKALRLLTQESK
jgi:hypothetical protein